MSSDNTAEVKISGDASGAVEALSEASSAAEESSSSIVSALEEMAAGATAAMSQFADGVKEQALSVNEQLETMTHAIDAVGKTFQLLGELMAGGIIGEKLSELARYSGEYAEQISNASQKTGIGVESLEGLKFAADISSVSFDQLVHAMTQLSKNMASAAAGSKETGAAFQAFGLNAKELQDLPLDQVLMKFADAFNQSADSQQKAAATLEIFGRSGADMIPFLNKGSEGIQELVDKARNMGLVLSASTISALVELNDQMNIAHGAMQAVGLELSQELLPGFAGMATAFADGVAKGGPMKQIIDDLAGALKTLVIGATYVAEGFEMLGNIIGAAAAKIANWITILKDKVSNLSQDNEQMRENADITADLHANIDSLAKSYDKLRDAFSNPETQAAMTGGGGSPRGNTQIHYTPPVKGAEESQMPELEAQLEIQKAQYAQENDLRQMSLDQIRQYWEQVLATVTLSSKDQLAVQKEIAEQTIAIDKDALKQRQDLALEAAQSTEKIALDEVNAEEQHAKALFDQKKMTADQLLQVDSDYEQQRLQITAAALAQRMAILQQDPDRNAVALQKTLDELYQAEAAYTAKVQQLHDNAVKEDAKQWQQLGQQITQSVGNSLKGLLEGTMTWQSAMENVLKGVLNIFVDIGEKMVEKWAETQLENLIETHISSTAGVASNAAVAGSAAYASTAAIPVVGPALAPAAAATAYAGALSYEGLASAEGGFDIPAGVNPLTQLHQNEMVLPASLADKVRNMSGGGGAMTVHFNVSAVDGASVKRFFNSNGGAIVKTLQRQMRLYSGGAG